MIINEILLINYRNFKKIKIFFSKKTNILIGKNAQGKTNFLESINLLSTTKSYRINIEKNLLFYNKEFAKIKGIIFKKNIKKKIEIIIFKNGKKLKLNNIKQKFLSNYIGTFNVILFTNEDFLLIKSFPQIRRNFIDIELGKINISYLYNLIKYKKILKQRNFYLKQIKKKIKKIDNIFFDSLTIQLVEVGSEIIYERIKFIKNLSYISKFFYYKISSKKENLKIKYISFEEFKKISINEIKKKMLIKLKKNFLKELLKSETIIGPHKDDIIFLINNKNSKFFSSQGQLKTIIFSIKLAEIELIFKEIKEYPILLLDDIMYELDKNRQNNFIKLIKNKMQIILTTTNLKNVNKQLYLNSFIFNVKNGNIKKIN